MIIGGNSRSSNASISRGNPDEKKLINTKLIIGGNSRSSNTSISRGNPDEKKLLMVSTRSISKTARGNATQKWFLTEYGIF